eukprot:CAMPEP_0174305880 /NCGR_PEP_ID=MMETSP0810-20121108/90_1 /TAXON_ID=73025 ORGANISM="Eutreptiella gymnastica-like, Strain CCMP1594" /NCGR_SAMPLE_ID=MMETSP0810 /ASSEMBLY_ACC=CAM_ASM_000659 /LENGTH=441 /DNA_ID=CAMNT_0015412431 /DNA_START=1547 /DNA_END=2867 /DNA_ORIENTATION=-
MSLSASAAFGVHGQDSGCAWGVSSAYRALRKDRAACSAASRRLDGEPKHFLFTQIAHRSPIPAAPLGATAPATSSATLGKCASSSKKKMPIYSPTSTTSSPRETAAVMGSIAASGNPDCPTARRTGPPRIACRARMRAVATPPWSAAGPANDGLQDSAPCKGSGKGGGPQAHCCAWGPWGVRSSGIQLGQLDSRSAATATTNVWTAPSAPWWSSLAPCGGHQHSEQAAGSASALSARGPPVAGATHVSPRRDGGVSVGMSGDLGGGGSHTGMHLIWCDTAGKHDGPNRQRIACDGRPRREPGRSHAPIRRVLWSLGTRMAPRTQRDLRARAQRCEEGWASQAETAEPQGLGGGGVLAATPSLLGAQPEWLKKKMRPVCGSGGVDRAGGQRQLRGKEGRGTGEEREGVGTVGYGTTDSGSDKERHIGTGGLDGKGRGIKPSG